MTASVKIEKGAIAWQTLSDAGFQNQWQTLCLDCPWGSPFQSPAFTLSWFETYGSLYQPVILLRRNAEQALDGLLVLALSEESNSLSIAGTHHAEYQVWLEAGDSNGTFLENALELIGQDLPGSSIVLRYVPERAIAPLAESLNKHPKIELRMHARPLWELDETAVSELLRKKHTRNRRNRLKRLGNLEFERVRDEGAFSAHLDKIIAYYDTRQGARNNSYPFQQDELKKQFHVQLLKSDPELLHVTSMSIDGEPVSTHIGFADDECVHMGIMAHSPMISRFSPGNLHVLLMAEHLLGEGKRVIDLTPGGDLWKERFATSHDRVYDLVLHESTLAKHKVQIAERVRKSIKALFGIVSVKPETLRSLVRKIGRVRPGAVSRRMMRFVWTFREHRVYRRQDPGSWRQPESAIELERDCLSHLLLMEPVESWQTKQGFLHQALIRLDNGEHVYTYVENGRLLHFGWLIDQQEKAYFSEVQQEFVYPEAGAVLYDFYTHPDARGRGLYQESIARMLADASATADTKCAYISCLADNGPSRHVIEKSGFAHFSTLYYRRLFGLSKSWR